MCQEIGNDWRREILSKSKEVVIEKVIAKWKPKNNRAQQAANDFNELLEVLGYDHYPAVQLAVAANVWSASSLRSGRLAVTVFDPPAMDMKTVNSTKLVRVNITQAEEAGKRMA